MWGVRGGGVVWGCGGDVDVEGRGTSGLWKKGVDRPFSVRVGIALCVWRVGRWEGKNERGVSKKKGWKTEHRIKERE